MNPLPPIVFIYRNLQTQRIACWGIDKTPPMPTPELQHIASINAAVWIEHLMNLETDTDKLEHIKELINEN